MKGFLNEPFVYRIFGFSTNSATMFDLDQKRWLVSFLWIQQIANQNEKKFKKEKR